VTKTEAFKTTPFLAQATNIGLPHFGNKITKDKAHIEEKIHSREVDRFSQNHNMPKRKNKKNHHPKKELAPLYLQDIGTEGMKKVGGMTMATSIHQPTNFHLPLTEEEEQLRRKRTVSEINFSSARLKYST
jgi:hypothetical protein